MATLTVGTGQQYSTIASAVASSRDGDIVQVQAGTYTNDFATINTKITLQGVGGMVKMVATGNIPNDKGILITNTDVTIDHFEFSGAKGASGNDAGIRYQGGNLVVTNSYFHHNQNGILGNAAANGTITIDNTEFASNGAGDGYTHNLYVGAIAKLTITDSYFHDAVVGNEIKSRAAETIISNTRVFDNAGSASWSIDLPNGGKAVLTGNVIEQGVNSQNSGIVSFGVEGNMYGGSSLTMTNNIIVNDMGRGTLVASAGGSTNLTGTQIWNPAGGSITIGAPATGTTTLTARPNLDTSAPYDGTTTPTTPTVPTTPTTPTTPPTPVVGQNLIGTARNDTLTGGSGSDTINGGNGNDVLQGAVGNDTLNGGIGNDTLYGGAGNDSAAGGQGNDLLFGDEGNDYLYGNEGADTLQGGNGADTLLGGQNNDVLIGGAGNDLLLGDMGNDTLTGGAGADIFYTWGRGGADRVLDFNYAQGDRVVVEMGTTGGWAQVGADVVISMTGGAQMTLAGVSLSSLGSDWISAY
jgi:Ca2+-binding RTX toxin-like protein